MKSNRTLPIIFLFLSTGVIAQVEQCPVPTETTEIKLRDKKSGIEVKAFSTQIEQDQVAEFAGRVQIISDTAQINAQQARIDRISQKLTATLR